MSDASGGHGAAVGTGVALVTGASRGIGADIARRLAADGLSVACAATSAANAAAVAAEREAEHQRAMMPVELHVHEPQSVRDAVAAVERMLGTVTLLVNNAGITRVAPIHEMSIEDFDAVIDVNLRGVYACSHVVARRLIDTGTPGVIINIGSVAGIDAFPQRSGYAASKAAVHHLTRVMALDLAPHHIRVNCVAPGYVRTDLIETLIDDGRLDVDALRRRIPLGDFGEGSDIAAAVAWLASWKRATSPARPWSSMAGGLSTVTS